jgi:hypothetical protein
MQIETEMMQQILASLMAKQPQIPVQFDRWDVAMIARVLKRSENYVRNSVICLPDFPKAIRLPVIGGGRGQPLYKAAEVLAWTDKYQERH